MLRQLFHLWLVSLILLNSMVYSVICANYQLNKELITAYFCVNKDKPEMHCDGKCFLSKQLEKEKSQKDNLMEFRADFNLLFLKELWGLLPEPHTRLKEIQFSGVIMQKIEPVFFDIQVPPRIFF
jgi:hypothetical protein